MKKITLIIVAFLTIISCNDDDNVKVGALNVDFSNVIDSKDIALNTASYTNESSETYKISELKYIISNIVLIKADGEEFKYPVGESYFLINEAEAGSKKINLSGITSGEYTKIKFGFGVDQSKYPFDAETPNFIPTAQENGMLWNWAAGYKFIKFEGTYDANGETNVDFTIHVGSHGDKLDNYQEIVLELPNTLTIGESTSPTVAINTDVSKIFDSTNTHSLQVKNSIQVDPEFAPLIAENISTMFSAASVTK